MEQYSIPLLGPVKSRSRKVVCTHVSYPPFLHQWQAGYLIPSTEPGHGVALNEAVAEQYPYTDDQLHREMTEFPVVFEIVEVRLLK